MNKKYQVILTPAERTRLQTLIGAGIAPARHLMHARILLKAGQSPDGPGRVDVRIADAVESSQPTVARIRGPYVEEGLAAALARRPPMPGVPAPAGWGRRGTADHHRVQRTAPGTGAVELAVAGRQARVADGGCARDGCHRPYVPRYPQVCFDETSKHLPREPRPALPMQPGQPARVDAEYERGGVVSLFLACEPLTGRRWVSVT